MSDLSVLFVLAFLSVLMTIVTISTVITISTMMTILTMRTIAFVRNLKVVQKHVRGCHSLTRVGIELLGQLKMAESKGKYFLDEPKE